MKENFLSQAEVDALLKKKASAEETGLRDTDKDVIGEVGNITMSTAATTLSSIISRRVSITTPKVSYIRFEEIIEECDVPKIVSRIGFKEGLKGNNLLMMDVRDSAIIADLMMGGDGSNANEVLTELELSAVSEAMNQMIGSASTSMARCWVRVSIFIHPSWKYGTIRNPSITESSSTKSISVRSLSTFRWKDLLKVTSCSCIPWILSRKLSAS